MACSCPPTSISSCTVSTRPLAAAVCRAFHFAFPCSMMRSAPPTCAINSTSGVAPFSAAKCSADHPPSSTAIRCCLSPRFAMAMAVSTWPLVEASMRGVLWRLFLIISSLIPPKSIRVLAASRCPFSAAKWSDVLPFLSLTRTSAPACTSSITSSCLPSSAACISGVVAAAPVRASTPPLPMSPCFLALSRASERCCGEVLWSMSDSGSTGPASLPPQQLLAAPPPCSALTATARAE
mmetsp:Transcript_47489/g.118797  ORF Transcript_47489/g.118797 Transcript_47489/m.118797 type:complete len:237 (+) Transcript_47489:1209-1919(+)